MSLQVPLNTTEVTPVDQQRMCALITNGCVQQRDDDDDNDELFDASTWLDDNYVKIVLKTILFKLKAPFHAIGTYLQTVAVYLDACGITSGTYYHKNGVRQEQEKHGGEEDDIASTADDESKIPFTDERFKGQVADSTWALQVGNVQRIQGFVLAEHKEIDAEDVKNYFIPSMFDTKEKVQRAYDLCRKEYENENTLASYLHSLCKFIFKCGVIDTRVNKFCKDLHLQCKERVARMNEKKRKDLSTKVSEWPAIVKRCMDVANDPEIVTHVRIVAAYIASDYELDDSEKDGLRVVSHNGMLRISDMANTKVITPQEHDELGWTAKDVDPDGTFSILNLSTGEWNIRDTCTKNKTCRTFYAPRFAKTVMRINDGPFTDHFLMVNARGKQVSSIAHVLKFNLKLNVTINDCRHLCTTYLATVRGMTTKEHTSHANAMGHSPMVSMTYYRYDDAEEDN